MNHLNGGGPRGGISEGSECKGSWGSTTNCGVKEGKSRRAGEELRCLKIDPNSKKSYLEAKKPPEKVKSGQKGVCGLY